MNNLPIWRSRECKALVIWAPGGEAGRITKNWKPQGD